MKLFRDKHQVLWVLAPTDNERKWLLFQQRGSSFTSFRMNPYFAKQYRLRPVDSSSLSWSEKWQVEDFYVDREYWLEWDKIRKSSLVFGITERIVSEIHQEACSLW